MDDDYAKQPLISGLLDTANQAKMKSNAKKRRFRRCRTAPSADVVSDPTKPNSLFPGSKIIFSNFQISFKQIAVCLAIYLGVGAVCFYLVRHQIQGKKTNEVLDALYFVIVTMTTVGYGDLFPDSSASKLLACAFVLSGMAIVALLLSRAADYLVEKQEVLLVKALHLRHKAGEAQMLREIEANRARYKFYANAIVLVVLIAVGVVFLLKVEKLSFVDAFYCVCSTITTLGYGDKSFSTRGGRFFAVFWILASTICLAQFFLYLAEMYTERRQQLLAKWVLTRKMTYTDLEAADLDEDGVVSAAEFVVYKLKEMGKISQKDIAVVMEEFENLDVDQSGTLSVADLVLAQSAR
ncbi:two pore potassium channel a isoform X1 [Iris pallida]|uniref:Two pore potassium channel a isoform X1 n=1 Tax=Iris pallida TaxID=29817 RepID=A0AAX6DQ55_IRIPA|nr:two pore potassium channel a isoform X1 [Iris pallida]KAJ6832106.1 two pore potassium channel a isoform X1 [Iris pallida]